MAWYRIHLSEDEQRLVLADRESHPQAVVRRRCAVLWALHCGLSREQAAKVADVGLSTVERFLATFRDGGLEAVRKCGREVLSTSELTAHAAGICRSLEERSARTIAECCRRIKELTGLERKPTQVRNFLKQLGLKWQRVHAIPVPPKKNLAEHTATQAAFLDEQLTHLLNAAAAGLGQVFFMDAAHFLHGTFLCFNTFTPNRVPCRPSRAARALTAVNWDESP